MINIKFSLGLLGNYETFSMLLFNNIIHHVIQCKCGWVIKLMSLVGEYNSPLFKRSTLQWEYN